MRRPPSTCGCGGIGRRAWFRSMFSQGSGGSSPLIRTIMAGIAIGQSKVLHLGSVGPEGPADRAMDGRSPSTPTRPACSTTRPPPLQHPPQVPFGHLQLLGRLPGSYEVSATANGFRTEVRTGVAVTVGGDSTVSFSLTVGAITEKVEVSEAAVQVDTASSALGGFVAP